MALTDKLSAIADAIRGKTGKTDTMTLDEMPTEIAGIQTGGGDNPLDYAKTVDFSYAHMETDTHEVIFGNKRTGGTVECPNFYCATGFRHLVVDSNGTFSNTTISLDSKFRLNSWEYEDVLEVVEIPLIEKFPPTTMNRAFQERTVLKEIRGTIDASNCTSFGNNALARCYKLESITFKAGTIKVAISLSGCSVLSEDSVQSIIDGLADLTGGTAQTLTLHADVGAKLTDEQKASASAKNWTISY